METWISLLPQSYLPRSSDFPLPNSSFLLSDGLVLPHLGNGSCTHVRNHLLCKLSLLTWALTIYFAIRSSTEYLQCLWGYLVELCPDLDWVAVCQRLISWKELKEGGRKKNSIQGTEKRAWENVRELWRK